MSACYYYSVTVGVSIGSFRLPPRDDGRRMWTRRGTVLCSSGRAACPFIISNETPETVLPSSGIWKSGSSQWPSGNPTPDRHYSVTAVGQFFRRTYRPRTWRPMEIITVSCHIIIMPVTSPYRLYVCGYVVVCVNESASSEFNAWQLFDCTRQMTNISSSLPLFRVRPGRWVQKTKLTV